MILDSILEASFRFCNFMYKLFEQYLVNNFVNFGRGFEQIFVMLAVTIFVLIRNLRLGTYVLKDQVKRESRQATRYNDQVLEYLQDLS